MNLFGSRINNRVEGSLW